ncbi:MAG: ester cyclase [Opitutales bacterium]
MNNAQIVQRFIEDVLNQGQISTISEIAHPQYRYTSPTEQMNGPEELGAFVAALRAAFPDLKVEILDQLDSGESVCTRIRFTGTHQGDFLGMNPSYKSVDVEGCIISKFQDARIHEEWEILDQLTMLKQLGVAA